MHFIYKKIDEEISETIFFCKTLKMSCANCFVLLSLFKNNQNFRCFRWISIQT